MAEVLVVGAGPVGTVLAAELARHGVEVRLLERRAVAGGGTRAIGVHAPVLAALEPSGITERLLAKAQRVPRGEARSGSRVLGVVRFDRLSTRFPFVATLPQSETEAVLSALAPVPERGAEVVGLTVRRAAVELRVARTGAGAAGGVAGADAAGAADGVAPAHAVDGAGAGAAIEHVAAPLVVIAGGWAARPLVYRDGHVPTTTYPDRYLMADIAVGDRPDADTAIVNLDPAGVLESFPLPGAMRRVVAWDAAAPPSSDDPAARVQRLQAALRGRGEASVADAVGAATEFGVRRVSAPRLRRGRLFVIGDTAHEVSPIGGQGMNLGLLDAVGLAPLLARWVHDGTAPEAELAAWEQRRVRSAIRAGQLAAVNTVLGRPRRGVADLARRTLVRGMLMPPFGHAFASAYAMGLDLGP
jgi:2-polyprenyl-6-methoxyphenol hydroxylase-like FAD-dependent oxidoreductase